MSWSINERQPSIGVSISRSHVLVDQSAEAGVTENQAMLVIHPDAIPQLIEQLQEAAYRISGPDLRKLKLNLPRALMEFLDPESPKQVSLGKDRDGRRPSKIEFLSRKQIRAENFRVRPQISKWRGKGPKKGDGYYAVPGVKLIQGQDADALLWLPVERQFALYDVEHTEMAVFRAKPRWSKLLADLGKLMPAEGEELRSEIFEYLRPWPQHPFVSTA